MAQPVSLTVGILAYNCERMLPELLESLPAGLAGVDDWHLVIADGASTDGMLDVARRLAAVVAGEALRALWRRTPIHRAAVRKLLRERRALVAGQPAQWSQA